MEEDQIFTEKQRHEIKSIVHEALVDFFSGYGKIGKNVIITGAIIVGSLTVIFGGLKTALAWLGFTYISR